MFSWFSTRIGGNRIDNELFVIISINFNYVYATIAKKIIFTAPSVVYIGLPGEKYIIFWQINELHFGLLNTVVQLYVF